MSSHNVQTYQPPGPVAAAYLNDRENLVRFIMGPIGSGKTSVNFADMYDMAYHMPVCRDGIRYFRCLVLRSLYQDLWATTIQSWNDEWFPRTVGKWSGSPGRAAEHILQWQMPDGSKLHFEIWFRALQDMNVKQAFRGIQMTTVFLNEADTLERDVLTYAIGRVAQRRYPRTSLLRDEDKIKNSDGELTGNYYTCVTGDLNPPDDDSWIYQDFIEKPVPGYQLYRQPSGRGPNGENRKAISRQQYEEIARLNKNKPWYVKTMVDGEFGYSRDGEPVYPEFSEERHLAADDLAPIRELGIRLSFDQGVRGPAMLVTQFTPIGQLRILDEYVPEFRMGPTRFSKGCRALLQSRYKGVPVVAATSDPAGFAGSDTEHGDRAWAEIVADNLNLTIVPAPTNELNARLDGVRQLLTYYPDGEPALLLNPRCRVMRRGFNSHYRYKVQGEGTTKKVDPKPEKNLWSNPQDALQYDVLDAFGLDGVVAGAPGGEGKGEGRWSGGDDDDDFGLRDGGGPSHDFDVYGV